MQYIGEFSSTGFELDDEAKDFVFWFRRQSYLREDFEIEVDEAKKTIDVVAFNPGFPTSALVQLFKLETRSADEEEPGRGNPEVNS